MKDEVRDDLTAAGQRIVYAEMLRQDALTDVRSLLKERGAEVSIADAVRFTALAEPELRRLLDESPG
jgi:Glu-tRNA(Gln) amidotransferase subunit E-like FAD-binding protein